MSATHKKARPIVILPDGTVFIDPDTGATGSHAEWVAAFAARWAQGAGALERFLDIMDAEIRLAAPGLKPTVGRAAGTAAFARVFAALPDLTGEVHRWAARGDALFIEMTFAATIGGRLVKWGNIDAFRFENGCAVERTAYFDRLQLQRAYLRNLRGFWQLIRLRLIPPQPAGRKK